MKVKIDAAYLEARLYEMVEEHQSIIDRGFTTEDVREAHALAVAHLEEIQSLVQKEI